MTDQLTIGLTLNEEKLLKALTALWKEVEDNLWISDETDKLIEDALLIYKEKNNA